MYKGTDSADEKRKYLKDFFVKTLLDKRPYTENATIQAAYADSKKDREGFQSSLFEEDDVLYKKENRVYYSSDRWAGYRHQPERNVYYYGMSYFIPYQEQNSNLLRDNNANVKKTSPFKPSIVKTVAEILSIDYATLQNNRVANDKREERVISATMQSFTYSENHMGCGEGRLLKLVNALESAPDKSLFVIEEPETALHQNAQYKLGKYLLDVCERKKHQIIFTTHSPEIQRALPVEARKYIQRNEGGETRVVNNPSLAEIENYFSGGHIKRMTIITEDEIAKLYFEEILREYDNNLFKNCEVFALNDGYTELKEYVARTREHHLNVFGIVDEKRRACIDKHIAAFPEETAPEVSFFSDGETVKEVETEFKFNCKKLDNEKDPHKCFGIIARDSHEELAYVQKYCVRRYVKNMGKEHFEPLISTINGWLFECELFQ